MHPSKAVVWLVMASVIFVISLERNITVGLSTNLGGPKKFKRYLSCFVNSTILIFQNFLLILYILYLHVLEAHKELCMHYINYSSY